MQRPGRDKSPRRARYIFNVHHERRGRREVHSRISAIVANTTTGRPPTEAKRSNILKPTHDHKEGLNLCTPTGEPLRSPPASQGRGEGDTNVRAYVQSLECPSSIRDHEVRHPKSNRYPCNDQPRVDQVYTPPRKPPGVRILVCRCNFTLWLLYICHGGRAGIAAEAVDGVPPVNNRNRRNRS